MRIIINYIDFEFIRQTIHTYSKHTSKCAIHSSDDDANICDCGYEEMLQNFKKIEHQRIEYID